MTNIEKNAEVNVTNTQGKRATRGKGDSPKYHENRRLTNKNVTDARINLADPSDSIDSATDHVTEFFGTVAARFSADEKYGRQHYNQDGFIHPDGVLRLSNESLVLMMLQAGETLSRRSAQKSDTDLGEGGSPSEAQRAIKLVLRFLDERTKNIAATQAADTYRSVMMHLGIDNASQIVSKADADANAEADTKTEADIKTEGKAEVKTKTKARGKATA